jgi:hypothetical protein
MHLNIFFLPSLFLPDGTLVRLCPQTRTAGKPLYCSRDGRFFSYVDARLRPIRPCIAPPRNKRLCHTRYPFMPNYGGVTCHSIMALTWIGPRPCGFECDHLNGNMLDWSADNIQWVTPAENRRRASVLRNLRKSGIDPCDLSRKELLKIINVSKNSN